MDLTRTSWSGNRHQVRAARTQIAFAVKGPRGLGAGRQRALQPSRLLIVDAIAAREPARAAALVRDYQQVVITRIRGGCGARRRPTGPTPG